MSASKAPARPGQRLLRRYRVDDLAVLSDGEARRFLRPGSDPRRDSPLAFELLYRLEPELYDRLAAAERLHPDVLAWLPERVGRVVEVGAGTGRLTLELARRARELVGVEPAGTLRQILERKLDGAPGRCTTRVVDGFFDALPVADGWADLVVSCSAFTAEEGHGADAGLAEMERVCRPGGCVALVWPNDVDWLKARGYRYLSFAGEVFVEFRSEDEALELIEIFYPDTRPGALAVGGPCRVTYEDLGVNAPRDIAFKVLAE